jgi:hypothetical protein
MIAARDYLERQRNQNSGRDVWSCNDFGVKGVCCCS